MGMSNNERQRRYVERLKARAEEPHSPDLVLRALCMLQPFHFVKGTAGAFAKRVIAEAERLSPGVTNTTEEIPRSVTTATPEIRSIVSNSAAEREATPLVTGGDDALDRLKSKIRRLNAKAGNRLDAVDELAEIGGLLKRAKPQVWATAGIKPKAAAAQKRWKKKRDQAWQDWMNDIHILIPGLEKHCRRLVEPG
jgi:hypothetical protein